MLNFLVYAFAILRTLSRLSFFFSRDPLTVRLTKFNSDRRSTCSAPDGRRITVRDRIRFWSLVFGRHAGADEERRSDGSDRAGPGSRLRNRGPTWWQALSLSVVAAASIWRGCDGASTRGVAVSAPDEREIHSQTDLR